MTDIHGFDSILPELTGETEDEDEDEDLDNPAMKSPSMSHVIRASLTRQAEHTKEEEEEEDGEMVTAVQETGGGRGGGAWEAAGARRRRRHCREGKGGGRTPSRRWRGPRPRRPRRTRGAAARTTRRAASPVAGVHRCPSLSLSPAADLGPPRRRRWRARRARWRAWAPQAVSARRRLVADGCRGARWPDPVVAVAYLLSLSL